MVLVETKTKTNRKEHSHIGHVVIRIIVEYTQSGSFEFWKRNHFWNKNTTTLFCTIYTIHKYTSKYMQYRQPGWKHMYNTSWLSNHITKQNTRNKCCIENWTESYPRNVRQSDGRPWACGFMLFFVLDTVSIWLCECVVYLNAFQVDGVHHRSLKKLHGCIMSLEESFKFQIRLLSVYSCRSHKHTYFAIRTKTLGISFLLLFKTISPILQIQHIEHRNNIWTKKQIYKYEIIIFFLFYIKHVYVQKHSISQCDVHWSRTLCLQLAIHYLVQTYYIGDITKLKTKNQSIANKTYRCRKTTSTSTSSRSSCKKSFRKWDTDSYVMWPHTTMCLCAGSAGHVDATYQNHNGLESASRRPEYKYISTLQ